MSMPGLDAVGRPVVGQISNSAATQVPIGWLTALSEPVRKRPRLPEGRQQFLAFNPQPFVSFGWMEPLTEPTRKKRGTPPQVQPFFAMQPAPSPFVATGWYAPLSTPVRVKPRSPAALSPFAFWQPAPSPFVATGWFAPMSEPLHAKAGLHAARQQFLAAPSRLLPTPTSFGVLDATETPDTMLAGAMLFNRPTDAEIGVINTTPQPAEIGVSPAAPTVGQVFCKIAITMPR